MITISTKVWDRTGIKLATPGSAVRHASVARHVTDCATRPGQPALYLRATGLRFFQNLSEFGVNKIVDATMPVNPYDDDWVSLRWPNGKDDFEIVQASKKMGRQ